MVTQVVNIHVKSHTGCKAGQRFGVVEVIIQVNIEFAGLAVHGTQLFVLFSQLLLHQSLFVVFQSSHCSQVSTTQFPHDVDVTDVQVELHASQFTVFQSSHTSGDSTIQFPHIAHQLYVQLHVHHVYQLQLQEK